MIVLEIKCDGCPMVGARDSGIDRKPAHVLRQMLKAAGWLIDPDHGRDLCPTCRQAATKDGGTR